MVALGLGVVMLGAGVVGANAYSGTPGAVTNHTSRLSSAMASATDLIESVTGEKQVPPGTIDDGKDLLPQAKISLDQAIAIAQSSESGDLGEVDLETFNDRLVFNVDIGDHDVKVDAADGTVLASSVD
jgi:uncharacterized membrane protein YkoI